MNSHITGIGITDDTRIWEQQDNHPQFMKSGSYSLYFAILTSLLAMILYILAYKTYFDVFHGNRDRGMTVFCTKKFYVVRNRATGGSRSSAIGVLIMIVAKGGGRSWCTSENNKQVAQYCIVVHQKTTHNGKHLSEEDQSGTAVGRLSKLSQVV